MAATESRGGRESGIPVQRHKIPIEEVVQAWQSERPRLHRTLPLNSVLTSTIPLYTENGEITPQGWVLSKVLQQKKQLRDLSQPQADELTARVLDIPKSWAVLLRFMTNKNPGSSLNRQQVFEQFLLKPEYFFGDVTEPLISLATRIDGLKREDWEKVQTEINEKYGGQDSGNQLGALTLPPVPDTTRMVRDAFMAGAEYSSSAAFGLNRAPSRATKSHEDFRPVSNDTLVAVGLAAIETLHQNEPALSGHSFFYQSLFEAPKQETIAETKTKNTTPISASWEEPAVKVMLPGDSDRSSEQPIEAEIDIAPIIELQIPVKFYTRTFLRSLLNLGLYAGGVFSLWEAKISLDVANAIQAEIDPTSKDVAKIDEKLEILDGRYRRNRSEYTLTRQQDRIAQLNKDGELIKADSVALLNDKKGKQEKIEPAVDAHNNQSRDTVWKTVLGGALLGRKLIWRVLKGLKDFG